MTGDVCDWSEIVDYAEKQRGRDGHERWGA